MHKTFSIRYKFLMVTTLLLLVCVGLYLALATRVFKRDKTELVFDYNRSTVSNISSDIETLFKAVADKMKLAAYFLEESNPAHLNLVQDLLANNSELVYVAGSSRMQELDKEFFFDRTYLQTYNLNPEFFSVRLIGEKPVPFERIQSEGEAIWNATTAEGPPLIGFGKSVVIEASPGRPLRHYAVIAFIKADKILNTLQEGHLNEVFVANSQGELLVHPDIVKMKDGQDSNGSEFINQALGQEVKTSVVSYESQGQEMLGAFSKSFNGRLIVLSRVSGERAFAVVNHFVYRSILFAMIVFTLAFIAAILFSRSLTRPLEVLMGGMKKVSEGQLDTQIQVKSRDEISVLAGSFNSMIRDLKQSREELEETNRNLEDKVKQRTLQLEKQNQAVKKAQETLLRTSRLAAVGEIAGRAAHEVLNPLTSIMSRVQRVKDRLEGQRSQETELLGQITEGWSKDYSEGGFEGLVQIWQQPSQVKPGASLWDEDLENLEQIGRQMHAEWDELRGDTHFLLKESQRISRIVQSMRSLSVVSGEKKPVSVSYLVTESVNIMADLASQDGIEIKVINQLESDTVAVDQDEFIQSLTNLIRNSLQAVRQATKEDRERNFANEVVIELRERQDQVEISVKDTGVGISPENQRRLFETQFSTKPKEEGTGLGLNISRRFIRAFGGDIYLKQSQIGQGSEFVISLPSIDSKQVKVSA